VGHPFSKPHPVKSILSEHVFKKCVKQENDRKIRPFLIKHSTHLL